MSSFPRPFHRLRVEATQGRPFIHKVAIQFPDGAWQEAQIERRLRPGEEYMIDLNGGERGIHRIVVYTEPSYRASYSIKGD
jgi:hypothetical protein